MTQKPPFAYKLLPAILIGALVAAIFFISSSISDDGLPGAGVFSEMIADYEREFDEIKNMAEDVKGILYKEPRKKRVRKKIKKPAPLPLAKNPRVIIDFNDLGSFPKLQINKSSGAIVSFGIVQKERDGKAGMAARLLIENIGEMKNNRQYGGGDLFLSPLVKVDGLQAIEVTVMGEGVSGFGLGIFSDRKDGWLRWDIMSTRFTKKGWATFTIAFVDFNLWRYDSQKQIYKARRKWINPKVINRIQIYLVQKDLVDGKSGTLWVDKVSLR